MDARLRCLDRKVLREAGVRTSTSISIVPVNESSLGTTVKVGR